MFSRVAEKSESIELENIRLWNQFFQKQIAQDGQASKWRNLHLRIFCETLSQAQKNELMGAYPRVCDLTLSPETRYQLVTEIFDRIIPQSEPQDSYIELSNMVSLNADVEADERWTLISQEIITPTPLTPLDKAIYQIKRAVVAMPEKKALLLNAFIVWQKDIVDARVLPNYINSWQMEKDSFAIHFSICFGLQDEEMKAILNTCTKTTWYRSTFFNVETRTLLVKCGINLKEINALKAAKLSEKLLKLDPIPYLTPEEDVQLFQRSHEKKVLSKINIFQIIQKYEKAPNVDQHRHIVLRVPRELYKYLHLHAGLKDGLAISKSLLDMYFGNLAHQNADFINFTACQSKALDCTGASLQYTHWNQAFHIDRKSQESGNTPYRYIFRGANLSGSSWALHNLVAGCDFTGACLDRATLLDDHYSYLSRDSGFNFEVPAIFRFFASLITISDRNLSFKNQLLKTFVEQLVNFAAHYPPSCYESLFSDRSGPRFNSIPFLVKVQEYHFCIRATHSNIMELIMQAFDAYRQQRSEVFNATYLQVLETIYQTYSSPSKYLNRSR